jgi:3-oxoacyl-[acyl-carrier protein] reductase
MRTLIITGASKGIGFETAKLFADDGYRVINISRTVAADSRIENHSIDLSGPDAETITRTLLDDILEDGVLSLVHNAARLINDSAADYITADFRSMLDINVVAPHILNQILIPKMQPGSSITYIGSTLSEKAVANSYSYVVSKHAVVGMMRSTCQDLQGKQIHTACVCPGFTDTEMLRTHVGEDQEILDSIASGSTFGRLVQPEEVAETIKFAATHPVINGTIIHANLGQIEN